MADETARLVLWLIAMAWAFSAGWGMRGKTNG